MGIGYILFHIFYFRYCRSLLKQKEKWGKRDFLILLVNLFLFYGLYREYVPVVFCWAVLLLTFFVETMLIFQVPWILAAFLSLQAGIMGTAFTLLLPRIVFYLGGALFFALEKAAANWQFFGEKEEKQELGFSVLFLLAEFLYLLALVGWFESPIDNIVRIWFIKNGICAVIALWIGLFYRKELQKMKIFERKAKWQRKKTNDQKIVRSAPEESENLDVLTGCVNRERGISYIKELFLNKTPFSLCFVDIDKLKEVNDAFGYDAGDRYLSAASYALKEVLFEKGDVLCRYGGDEFLLILLHGTKEEREERIWEAILHLEEQSHTKEYPFSMSFTSGEINSSEVAGLEELLEKSDQRMYQNKKSKYGMNTMDRIQIKENTNSL